MLRPVQKLFPAQVKDIKGGAMEPLHTPEVELQDITQTIPAEDLPPENDVKFVIVLSQIPIFDEVLSLRYGFKVTPRHVTQDVSGAVIPAR